MALPPDEQNLTGIVALDAALAARVDLLLRKHHGDAYAEMLPSLILPRLKTVAAQDNPRPLKMKVAALMIVAAGCPVASRRTGWMPRIPETFQTPDGAGDRAACRNERLLMRLIVRGLRRRGEWPPPA